MSADGELRWLAQSARRRGDHGALITRDAALSYADLEAEANSLAAKLRALDVRPGDRVAALLGNDPSFVVLVHALIGLEATLVPLNVRLTAHELARLLADSAPRLLITSDPWEDKARDAVAGLDEVRVVPVSHMSALPEQPGQLIARPDPEMDQAVLFTSGTTGDPKGVRLTLANQHASALASSERLGAREYDRWLLCMPLYHVGGLAVLLRSALYATTVLLHERFDPVRVATALEEDEVGLVSLVPTMLQRVLDAGGLAERPESLRVILLGGGPIPEELVARCRERALPIAATYGLTEAASQVATASPGDTSRNAVTALPRTQIRIVDEAGRICDDGEPGEILVRGPQVMAGYLDRPEESARVLAGGWLRTGDIGALDRVGGLSVFDRRTDLIVSGGENIYPAEVESVLLAHLDVEDAGVIGRGDPEWGQAVHAVVVRRAGSELDEKILLEWARERLAGFKLPRSLEFASELPRTASGKLRRGALRDSLV